ncbi:MAG: hypothetical protein ACYC27_06425 [Armatimonadota bacterium]
MRVAIIVAMIFCMASSILAASVTSAPVRVSKSTTKARAVSKIKSVNELRQMKFAVKPIIVKSPGTPPDQTPMITDVGASADTAYKTGSGVVLQPAFLTDSVTGSIGTIYLLSLGSDILTKLQNKEQDIEAIMSFTDQAHSTTNTILFSSCFQSIPQGTHTYVFTCRFRGGDDLKPRIRFWAGDQQIGPDKQTTNSTTNEISILFSYTPKDKYTNYLSVGAYLSANTTNNTYAQMTRFYYMQLVQIN